MAQRTISSSMTLYFKVIFPLFWGGIWGAVTTSMWLGTMKDQHGATPPMEVKLLFTIVGIVGLVFILKLYGAIKKVRMDDNNLYISNYRREITLPRSTISRVSALWPFVRPTRVVIEFQRETAFGKRILFMPRLYYSPWKQHPIVAELKQIPGQPIISDTDPTKTSSPSGIALLKYLCLTSSILCLAGANSDIWSGPVTSSDPALMSLFHNYGRQFGLGMGALYGVFAAGLQVRARFTWFLGWVLLFLTYLQTVGQAFFMKPNNFHGVIGPQVIFMAIGGAIVIAYWGTWWNRQKDYFFEKNP